MPASGRPEGPEADRQAAPRTGRRRPTTPVPSAFKKVAEPPSIATIWRVLKREGLITPQPHKRPRSSFIRFEAKLPNETWQVDATRWRGGQAILELKLERLGIVFKHSNPNHPQTCGKVERFHQTLKRFLKKQTPAESLAELQFQLDGFREYYHHVRPHRALNRQTPMSVLKVASSATSPSASHIRTAESNSWSPAPTSESSPKRAN